MKISLDMDINILLSVINTKLRNHYDDLDSLCRDLNLNKEELIIKLQELHYQYSKEVNQFVYLANE
ncbi:MAG: DUF4250 domain-containing protein [Candidatus Izemoplasmatales bacterium]|nr:DUF4250 domain-containing protein [Candidatus Izemoplasmatales bacterium]